ncbi:MAG: Phosphoenolpyruvate-protein phosphotransferase, partial [Bacteroidota bacterium]|nr:Phosphoenolpyruvate-protein phosphotransferase [Bacteroidota bacterium]
MIEHEKTVSYYKTETIPSVVHAVLKGIPSSSGYGIGRAVVLEPDSIIIPTEKIPTEDIPNEIDRFIIAVNELVDEFIAIMDKVKDEPQNVTAILETNIFILRDDVFTSSVLKRINEGYSAESAVVQEFDHQRQFFQLSKDKILREKVLELDQLKERLLALIRNRCIYYAVGSGVIVVAQSLTPTDIINFKESKVAGIITEVGGIASHVSILARSFELPAVIGIKDATALITHGSSIALDGYTGFIQINPTNESIDEFRAKVSREEERKKEIGHLIKLPAKTIDGKLISLMTNIDFPEDVEKSVKLGADGIGLFRTEHLIMASNRIPEEDEQFEMYQELAQRAYPGTITI